VHSTNYTDTLILPSEDCRAEAATPPAKAGTVAALQFEMLSAAPYVLTSDDLLIAVEARRKSVAEADLPALSAAFHARGQACLRASPLVKSHGWALHHDSQSRVALVDPSSEAFAQISCDPSVTQVRGMRNRRT
jgi:hypothetical protein